MRKTFLAACAAGTLAACSQTPQEHILSAGPAWYLAPPAEDGTVYGAGMSASSDLQFAVDKAILQAKSSLADQMAGRTSVLSRSHATQHGAIVTRSDDKTVRNEAHDVGLGGYVVDKIAVTTEEGVFRAYVLVRYVPAAPDDLDKAMDRLDAPGAPVGVAPGVVSVAPMAPTPAVPDEPEPSRGDPRGGRPRDDL